MASRTTKAQTNGSGARKLASWIGAFIDYTENTESPLIFRKWTAIATLAAVLEQKVWIVTSSPMYANMYTFLVGKPGIGKSRVLGKAREMIEALPDPYIAPTSVNAASLVDHMVECKRTLIMMPDPAVEYNCMTILVGEFGTFMSKYEDDLIAMLTDMYDVNPYGQRRRGNQLKIKIERPLLNMVIGSTPRALLDFMPDHAWEQGFTSRLMLIYSDEKNMVDDFADHSHKSPEDLIHDLRIVNNLAGKFGVTSEYADAIRNWRQLVEDGADGISRGPTHPKLLHYCTRRKAHLYRLSMVAAVNRSNTLILTKDDFNTAMGWMLEAERGMGSIFRGPSGVSDDAAMDEILHYIMEENLRSGKAVSERNVVKEAHKRVPANAVLRVIELMEKSGMIKVSTIDRTGLRYFVAIPRPSPDEHAG